MNTAKRKESDVKAILAEPRNPKKQTPPPPNPTHATCVANTKNRLTDTTCFMKASRLAILAIMCFVALSSVAQSTTSISFQGALTGANGQPLANGNYNLTFKFYDVPTSGTALATSNVPNVLVTGGIASTPIPVAANWFDGQTRYLGIAIAGINGGLELSPRVLVMAVPYALYAHTTRGISVDPTQGPPIGFARPNKRVVFGTTTEDISRLPTANEALVVGTTNYAAGTTVGLYFDTDSRTGGGIFVEKTSGGGNEDHLMHFYVTREGDLLSTKCMTLSGIGFVGIGSPAPHNRLVVGTTRGDRDRMPVADEVLVIGTTNNSAGTSAGIYFDTNDRNAGGIRMEKVSAGSIEDHRMRFYVTKEGDIDSHNYMTIYENGVTEVVTLRILGGADLAEHLNVTSVDPSKEFKVEPGMVVSIDSSGNREFKLSDEPYDRKRVGIISGGNGVKPGLVLRDKGNPAADGEQPIALTGQVWCRADAGFGPISPGDLLTTSATLGHAMKVSDFDKARFAVLGQALTELKEGRGWVQVLVGKQ